MKQPRKWTNYRKKKSRDQRIWLRKRVEIIGPMYWDRQGRVISLKRWSQLHQNLAYKRVAQSFTERHWVSTMWDGIDHGMSFMPGAKPMFFETMLFCRHDGGDPHFMADVDGDGNLVLREPVDNNVCQLYRHQIHYFTEKQATRSHGMIVRQIRELEKQGEA